MSAGALVEYSKDSLDVLFHRRIITVSKHINLVESLPILKQEWKQDNPSSCDVKVY